MIWIRFRNAVNVNLVSIDMAQLKPKSKQYPPSYRAVKRVGRQVVWCSVSWQGFSSLLYIYIYLFSLIGKYQLKYCRTFSTLSSNILWVFTDSLFHQVCHINPVSMPVFLLKPLNVLKKRVKMVYWRGSLEL